MRAPAFHPLYVLFFCLTPAALRAQVEAPADVLTGRVTDATGRPVADAQVGATSLGSGRTRSINTDAQGRYRIFFPENARQYQVLVKRMGFAPVQRTITRHTNGPEEMTIDLQLGGMPLALSMVEVTPESDAGAPRETDARPDARPAIDRSVPNPVAEIIALKDTLHLSAVQMVGLTDVADTLQSKNTRIYRNIQALLAKSQEAGDVSQMAGTVAMMLEEASGNTTKAVTAAEKLLSVEQWQILPQAIRDQVAASTTSSTKP